MRKGSSVEDFSRQWTSYARQSGHYASEAMLSDYLGPLLQLQDLAGKDVCEVGCGNGRFLRHFARYAASVTGIEPSDAHRNSVEHTRDLANVRVIRSDIYDVTIENAFDYVFCLGVLHHTPDPIDAVRTIRRMTRPGGYAVIWTYGREGNGIYLALARALRVVTTRLPTRMLRALARALRGPLKGYVALARAVPVPLRAYVRNVLGTYDDYALELTIYDQLNPSIAGYWTRAELASILAAGGMPHAELHHRHGYSWTARVRREP